MMLFLKEGKAEMTAMKEQREREGDTERKRGKEREREREREERDVVMCEQITLNEPQKYIKPPWLWKRMMGM